MEGQIVEPWGELVSLNPKNGSIKLIENEVTFGRSSENDQVFKAKMISYKHCKLIREEGEKEEERRVIVEDYSANGTYINSLKIGKGKTGFLLPSDELSLGIPSSESAKDTKFSEGNLYKKKEQHTFSPPHFSISNPLLFKNFELIVRIVNILRCVHIVKIV